MFQLRDVTPNEVRRIISETMNDPKKTRKDKISFEYFKTALIIILYILPQILSMLSEVTKLSFNLEQLINKSRKNKSDANWIATTTPTVRSYPQH